MTTPSSDYRSLFNLSHQEQLRGFADMRRFYPTRVIANGENARPIPIGKPIAASYEFDGRTLTIDDFMQRYSATGLMILKRGANVCERYAHGHSPSTRWISFSMAKSISSTLIGAAIHDGLIGSIDEPVVRTVPRLRGSAYDGVSIRNVLQMSSGVRWVETYLDPDSDRRKLLELQMMEKPGLVLDYMSKLPRVAEPGTHFNYNTAETYLLGLILAGATGKAVSQYLSEKIWKPCGMESEAYWQLESAGGQEFAGSGISATLRDYARFGLFVLADGVIGNVRVLPECWVAQSTAVDRASRLAPGKLQGFEPLGYGFQWWTVDSTDHRTAFGALGIFGQQIYIDVEEEMVIVLNAAWPEPMHEPSRLESYEFFAGVTKALRGR